MTVSRYRFLLQRRWVLFGLAVIIFVVACWQLSAWQLRRLDERRAENHIITSNIDADPVPVGDLLGAGHPLDPDHEWHPVKAHGRYDTQDQVLVRYRTWNGQPGFHVLTPLVTARGPTLLVDRGWVPNGTDPRHLPQAPDPPSGEVTVTGRARQSEHGPAKQVRPRTGQIRYIDVGHLDGFLPGPVYDGYIELTAEHPSAGQAPKQIPPPDISEGPHLAYAIQWAFFGVLAVGGVIFFAYDEATDGRFRDRMRSQRAPARGNPGTRAPQRGPRTPQR